MSNPKVLVGAPTSDFKEYCLKEFAEIVKNLSYDNYDVLLVDNSETNEYSKKIESEGIKCVKVPYTKGVKERIAQSREVLRKKAIEENYDYFLSLEQDIIPPRDIIQKLMSHDKLVISALYTKLMTIKNNEEIIGKEEMPVLFGLDEERRTVKRFFPKEIEGKKLIRIYGGGFGCLLIHNSALKQVKFRIGEDQKGCDDMYFFRDIQEKNIAPYADLTLKCHHLEKIWDERIRKS